MTSDAGMPNPLAGFHNPVGMPRNADAGTGAAQTRELSPIDRLLMSVDLRGIAGMHVAGGAEVAADALFQERAAGGAEVAADALFQERVKRVMLVTGFNVAEGKPETDGPVGTAVLAYALAQLGIVPTLVTDRLNQGPLISALKVIDPKLAEYVRVVTFEPSHEEGPQAATQLLKKHPQDMAIFTEVPGRTAEDGVRRNMRGMVVNDFNAPLDDLALAAQRMEIPTVGVWDGGNEVGAAGHTGGTLRALDGSVMGSGVRADFPVTAWNSNLGAIAIAAILMQKEGKLGQMPTPAQLMKMIEATLEAGAVDGVTRGRVAGEIIEGAETGVDGFGPDVHAADYKKLQRIVAATVEETPRNDSKPEVTLAANFDSSNGGIVALKTFVRLLEARYPYPVRLVVRLDHHHAPYGDLEPGELSRRVDTAVIELDGLNPAVIAFTCNTACTVDFPEIETPIADLIEETARALAGGIGGARPFMLATAATAASPDYPEKIGRYSNGTVEPTMQAAPKWARLINDVKHLSDKPEDIAELRAAIDEIIDQVPENATSVVLACTHYPAIQDMIEARMKERGLGHIEVIDPMEFQVEAAITILYKQEMARQQQQQTTGAASTRTPDLRPLIITSGDPTQVQEAADAMLRDSKTGDIETVVVGVPMGAKYMKQIVFGLLNSQPEEGSGTRPARPAVSSPEQRNRAAEHS